MIHRLDAAKVCWIWILSCLGVGDRSGRRNRLSTFGDGQAGDLAEPD